MSSINITESDTTLIHDVIIAIVPAPGHEGLVAPVPSVLPHMAFMEPERPALLTRCAICSRWDCVEYAHWIDDRVDLQRALVLYAPGGPKLGMVRAMEAVGFRLDGAYNWGVDIEDVQHYGKPVMTEAIARTAYGDRFTWPVPDPDDLPSVAYTAFAIAHLALQRGLGVEVLVLPVSP